MSSAQAHIINRQILEVSFPTRGEAMSNRDEISRIYHHDLLPLINEIFDKAVSPETHVRIDHLEIDLGKISSGRIEEEFLTKLREKLVEGLSKVLHEAQVRVSDVTGSSRDPGTVSTRNRNGPSAPVKHAASTISSKESTLALFTYFVETGRLPWWAGKNKVWHFEEITNSLLEKQPGALATVLRELMGYSNYLDRLIHQLPDGVLVSLLDLLHPRAGDSFFQLHEDLYSIHAHRQLVPLNDTGFRLICWQSAFQFCAAHRRSVVTAEGGAGKTFPSLTREYVSFLISRLLSYSQDTTRQAGRLKLLTDRILTNMKDLSRKKHSFHSRTLRGLVDVMSKQSSEALIDEPLEDLSSDQDHPDRRSGKRLEKKRIKTSESADEESVEVHNAGLVLLWPFLPALFEGIGLTDKGSFVTEDAAKRGALLLQYAVTKEREMPEYDLALNKLLCGIDIDEPLDSRLTLTASEEEEIEHLLGTVAQRWEALKGSSGEALRCTFLTRDGILCKPINGWKLTIERSAVDMLLDKLPWSISIIKLPWSKQALYVEW